MHLWCINNFQSFDSNPKSMRLNRLIIEFSLDFQIKSKPDIDVAIFGLRLQMNISFSCTYNSQAMNRFIFYSGNSVL